MSEVRSAKYEEGPADGGALGLYLHIPFCQAICSYCNFNRGLFDARLKARYVRALRRELVEAGDGQHVDTIFFGGGTPSLLDPGEVAAIVDACRDVFAVDPAAEITLETNPETVTAERMAGFLAAGVTRFSFGAQSFDDGQLQRLGRIHDAARIADAVAAAREAGVTNLSLDLMFWLPGQSIDKWLESVRRAIEVGPDHLSLYLLELYPNAPLKEAMARAVDGLGKTSPIVDGGPRDWAQASDDEAADMYLQGLDLLDAAGYEQYEISNVARGGFESRHNLKYWTAGTWLGAGCGAHSTTERARWQNVSSVTDYLDRIEAGRLVRLDPQVRNPRRAAEEALFTGLRLSRGVGRTAFRERFGVDPWVAYEETLSDAREAGHVWRHGDMFGLTRPGMLVANEIFMAFV